MGQRQGTLPVQPGHFVIWLSFERQHDELLLEQQGQQTFYQKTSRKLCFAMLTEGLQQRGLNYTSLRMEETYSLSRIAMKICGSTSFDEANKGMISVSCHVLQLLRCVLCSDNSKYSV